MVFVTQSGAVTDNNNELKDGILTLDLANVHKSCNEIDSNVNNLNYVQSPLPARRVTQFFSLQDVEFLPLTYANLKRLDPTIADVERIVPDLNRKPEEISRLEDIPVSRIYCCCLDNAID